MLRLCHQIARDQDCIALLTDEYSFGRTSKELNRAIKRDQLFGRSYITVAGPHNLVHMGNTLRAVGERSDGLRPANAVELSHAKKCGGRQSCLGWTRRCHANLGYARDMVR